MYPATSINRHIIRKRYLHLQSYIPDLTVYSHTLLLMRRTICMIESITCFVAVSAHQKKAVWFDVWLAAGLVFTCACIRGVRRLRVCVLYCICAGVIFHSVYMHMTRGSVRPNQVRLVEELWKLHRDILYLYSYIELVSVRHDMTHSAISVSIFSKELLFTYWLYKRHCNNKWARLKKVTTY